MKFIPTSRLTQDLTDEYMLDFKTSKNIAQKQKSQLIKPIFISSYIPRKCGIATFTRDLSQGLNTLPFTAVAQILVMENPNAEVQNYPKEAKVIVNQDSPSDYRRAARFINTSSDIDIVCLQHEFGIYGGKDGEMVVPFIQRIEKPIITTFHTILPHPSQHQIEIIQAIARRSEYVVVMMYTGAQLLTDIYNVPMEKIKVIPHGVPTFPKIGTNFYKNKLHLSDKVVMTSINLLSPAKGIEYAIESLPKIVEQIPNFVYLVVGQTHPNELSHQGRQDTYREKLIALAKSLGVESHIQFVNKYVTVEELVEYIAASDYYVTPYIDPQQITSGALAYAIGAGKMCISTPYLYAKELLGKRGVLVPFKGSQQIAEAVIKLHRNPTLKKSYETKTYQIGKLMTWDKIATGYLDLFKQALYNQLFSEVVVNQFVQVENY